ncbi:hypothetical protein OC835_005592, partial [Tilletia horrida]
SKPRTEFKAPDLSNELTLPQVQRILTFGRTQGWSVEPEDVVDRLFRQLKAYTDVIIKDLVKELADVDQYALTDLDVLCVAEVRSGMTDDGRST